MKLGIRFALNFLFVAIAVGATHKTHGAHSASEEIPVKDYRYRIENVGAKSCRPLHNLGKARLTLDGSPLPSLQCVLITDLPESSPETKIQTVNSGSPDYTVRMFSSVRSRYKGITYSHVNISFYGDRKLLNRMYKDGKLELVVTLRTSETPAPQLSLGMKY